jgi:hypothetical protein
MILHISTVICVVLSDSCIVMAVTVVLLALELCLSLFGRVVLCVLQTGKMGGEAYRAAGITGKGQVCGIADSGLNDLSCFFYDGPSSLSPSSPGSHTSAYRGVLTNRSGLIEPLRRKVIQYTAYADMTDELGETAIRCNRT